MSNPCNVRSFESFFQGWLVRQEHMNNELISAQENCHRSPEEYLKDLITRVLAHYQQYYEEKSKIAQRNIFSLFAPNWFTPFEQTFLWVAGFKPALAFRLVNESVNDLLSDEQRLRIAMLMGETRIKEKLLDDELATIQESVANQPFMELARKRGRFLLGEATEEEEVMRSLRTSLETLVASADLLRRRTAANVVEILNPVQNVKFLTAATQLQLKIRRLGFQKANDRDEGQLSDNW